MAENLIPDNLAGQVETMFASEGWRTFWKTYKAMADAVERVMLRESDMDPKTDTVDAVAMKLRYRQGFAQGTRHIESWINELPAKLREGKFNWLETYEKSADLPYLGKRG